MHLNVRLPSVQPETLQPPKHCPYLDRRQRQLACRGTHFMLHQVNCHKPLRDTRHTQVRAQRYRCLTCRRTFRVYPPGVSSAQQSARAIAPTDGGGCTSKHSACCCTSWA